MSETDLVHHYTVLKQFLDISDDSNTRSKSNSSRAVRAREKLFKLSSAQFRELSTDVHDELKRRIDESRGEPDYLLPKSSFHPKRNQARQKLSSLPQSRFKDLVSDISYEIERRGLHKEDPGNTEQRDTRQDSIATSQYAPTEYESPEKINPFNQPHENEHEKDHENDGNGGYQDDDPNTSQNQTIGIQSTTVVPTKANLAWSSDEEDDGPGAGASSKKRQTTHLLTQLRQKEQMIEELRDKLGDADTDRVALEEELKRVREQHEAQMAAMATEGASREQQSSQSAELDSLRSENKRLRSEIQQLRMARAERAERAERPERSSVDSASSSSSRRGGTRRDVEAFFDKLANLEAKSPSRKRGDSYVEMKNDLTRWQTKYEDLRSERVSEQLATTLMTRDQMQGLVVPHGLISIKLVADFHALAETFISYLRGDAPDTDVLFDKISKLSILANEIAIQGDNQHFNSSEHAIALREAVGYALTATRYFAVYAALMPRIVVERAVGELCFTLCDLVTAVKLNEGSQASRSVSVKVPAGRLVEEETFVRPLRMAKGKEEKKEEKEQPRVQKVQTEQPKVQPKVQTEPKIIEQKPQAAESLSKPEDKPSVAANFLRKFSPFAAQPPVKEEEKEEEKKEPKEAPKQEAPKDQSSLDGPASISREAPASKSKFAALASRFENSEPQQVPRVAARNVSGSVKQFAQQYDGSSPQTSPKGPAPRSPQGRSIMDKVKRYESPPSPAKSVSDDSSIEIPKRGDRAEGKGLFQSIRDRLASEESKDEPVHSDDVLNSEEEANISNDKVMPSTAETTPSKESEPEPPVKSGGFFQAIRDRLTTEPDVGNMKPEMRGPEIERVPSSTASDVTIRQDVNDRNDDDSASPLSKKPTKTVTYAEPSSSEEYESDESDEEAEARQRQEYRKSIAAATFNIDLFDIDDPDNTLTQVLLYLEHQTVQVIATIQSLLSAIKKPDATRGDLRAKSQAITEVISQMTEATNTSMNQTRNAQLKEHGSWVVRSLEDCHHRMNILCKPTSDKKDSDFADKNFKQRLAGISFDIAKCTKELVKTVEEASLKEDIANLDARLQQGV